MEEIELISGFENAVLVDDIPDRLYEAEDINTRYEGLVSSYGVYSNIDNACQVVADSGLKIIVKTGKGEINNHWFKISADTQLELEAADVVLNRIDSVVIRRSNTDRNITLTIKKGELASEPVAPVLVRNSDIQEIFLANIRVNARTTSITGSNITDLRPSNEYCGFIACLVEQIDTTTLFNQYEAAQQEFVNTKEVEFEQWFESVKNDIRSTSVYREYESVYIGNAKNDTVIPIPTEINYSYNSLDILSVYINGNKMARNTDYQVNSDNTITLTKELTLANQEVLFVNKKSIDDASATEVIVQVEALETKVQNLEVAVANVEQFAYIATGTADDVALSKIVTNFLDGIGDYAGLPTNASMRINVRGRLGLSVLTEGRALFDFNSETESLRRVFLDFADATIVMPSASSSKLNLIALFSQEENVIIENANVNIEEINVDTIYVFHGGRIKNCNINISNNTTATNLYGVWAAEEVINCWFNIESENNVYGAYSCSRVLFNRINVGNGIGIYSGNMWIGNTISGQVYEGNVSVNLGNSIGLG